MIAHGEVDFGREFAPSHVLGMNAAAPITILTGLHVGWWELVGKSEIPAVGGLKGRSVGTDIYISTGNDHDQARRSRSGQGYPLGHRSITATNGPLHRGQDRRLSRRSAGTTGSS